MKASSMSAEEYRAMVNGNKSAGRAKRYRELDDAATTVNNDGVTIKIRPMSVNEAWQGRRFKSEDYIRFEKGVLFLLPKIVIPPAPYEIFYDFGLSNSASDIDNPVKPFQDILQKKYGINDKHIMKLTIKKTIVKQGAEYIYFKIMSHVE